jgi:hypothetical protein
VTTKLTRTNPRIALMHEPREILAAALAAAGIFAAIVAAAAVVLPLTALLGAGLASAFLRSRP